MKRFVAVLALLFALTAGTAYGQTFTAQIQQFWNLLRTGKISFVNVTAQTISQTSNSPFAIVYTGSTSPSNYYANALVSANITLANGLGFATGLFSYYKYAPTDSDASGLSRIALMSYVETGGSQNLASIMYGARFRSMHLGTGTAGGSWGADATAFNGHAGEQGTTGGNMSSLYGLRGSAFQQSTLGAATTVTGVYGHAEVDYGTTTTSYGGFFDSSGGAPGVITTSYGAYVGSMYGTTKWSFFSSDATAPSSFAGSTITPIVQYTTKVNGSGFIFANIATVLTANGDMAYCSDCTIANPCAGGGTGALAKRLNGVNVCN